jgi:hypothetical protein
MGMFVRPARTLNVDVPATPDMNSSDVLMSCENVCPPLRTRKLAFAGRRPFCVNATAMTLDDPAVF